VFFSNFSKEKPANFLGNSRVFVIKQMFYVCVSLRYVNWKQSIVFDHFQRHNILCFAGFSPGKVPSMGLRFPCFSAGGRAVHRQFCPAVPRLRIPLCQRAQDMVYWTK